MSKTNLRQSATAGGLTFLSVLFAIAVMAGSALAQSETGQITGKVSDPNGAVVAGAAINLKSVETGAQRTATTNEDGVYSITNLQPGIYELTVQAANFAKSTQKVQVTVGAKASVDTTLSVSALSTETVDVVDNAGVEVNTQTQELSDVVSGTQIRELPTVTRNPYNLVQLSGNATTDDPSTSQNGTQGTATWRGAGASLNGQRAASTNVLLDGADNNDSYQAIVGQNVPLDSVQEFRVITSNFSSEYGRATGGIINVATRGGANDFHGSAYAFNRLSRLASNGFANNAFSVPRGVFTRNQFGYSFGGRVIKDKLFFFNSTEWTRVRSQGELLAFVPTPELISLSAPATRDFFSAYTLAARTTGRIRTAAELGITGVPGNTPAFQEVAYSVPTDLGGGFPQNDTSTVTRVDWIVSDKTQIYGRYALQDNITLPGTGANSPYQGFNTGTTAYNQNFLASLTHTLSPNLVSATKLAFNRVNTGNPLAEQPPGPTLYMNETVAVNVDQNTPVNVAFPGYLPFGPGLAIPANGPSNQIQIYQDMNFLKGHHQFRFGGQYFNIQQNRTFGAFLNSVQTLGVTNVQAYNNLVAGRLVKFQGAVDPQGGFPGDFVTTPLSSPSFSRSNVYNEWAAYFNDAWRIRPTLTLNLGLRYEYYGVQHNKNPELDSNFYFGSGNTLQERIRNGSVQIAKNSAIGSLWKPDRNNFAPRVGFAWDIFGDGRTSLRGGYGIAYERNFGNVTFNVIQNPPAQTVIALTAGVDVPSLAISRDNAGPLAGSGTTVRIPAASLRHVREDIVNAYSHFWSAAFEREFGQGTVASIEYSGSAGRSLYSLENINRSGSGLAYLGSPATTPTGGTSSRLNGQYTNINTRANNGFSNYNALVIGIASNNFRNKGLQFTARYTLSTARDNLSSTFSDSNANGTLGLLDPFDPKFDYGYADFDARHRFVTSFNYEVPFFKNADSSLVRNVLGGFALTGIISARTGNPFTVYDCTTASSGACPRYVPSTGSISSSGSGSSQSVGANSFSFLQLPAANPFFNPLAGNGVVGPFPAAMSKRNAFRGPGYWNADMGLYKRVRFSERYSMQLRLEAFNVFNHSNLFIVPGSLDISGFTDAAGNPTPSFIPAQRGVFTSGNLERRNVQLAVKFLF